MERTASAELVLFAGGLATVWGWERRRVFWLVYAEQTYSTMEVCRSTSHVCAITSHTTTTTSTLTMSCRLVANLLNTMRITHERTHSHHVSFRHVRRSPSTRMANSGRLNDRRNVVRAVANWLAQQSRPRLETFRRD